MTEQTEWGFRVSWNFTVRGYKVTKGPRGLHIARSKTEAEAIRKAMGVRELTPEELAAERGILARGERKDPRVPTKQEVLDAGYTEEAADQIVAEEEARARGEHETVAVSVTESEEETDAENTGEPDLDEEEEPYTEEDLHNMTAKELREFLEEWGEPEPGSRLKVRELRELALAALQRDEADAEEEAEEATE